MKGSSLKGKTLLITGASRGIGKAVGLRAARDGANVVVAAKTVAPHPKLPGTIHTAAEEMEAAGGQALACPLDIRIEDQIRATVDAAVERFGGIDILVNNASAISPTRTLETPAKRFDLMHQVNTRGTFLMSQACIPHLRVAANPHILNMAPSLQMDARWFAPHVAYSLAKYGMSLCVLGMSEEFRQDGIAVDALWPRTGIATAAIRNLLGGEAAIRQCRKPEIVGDAAHAIFTRDSRENTGNFYIDDEVLAEEGITDLERYAMTPGVVPIPTFFV